MFNQVVPGGRLSVGDVVKVLEKRYPYVEVSSILGADSSYEANRKVSLSLSLFLALALCLSEPTPGIRCNAL